jgi:hypothetical protein
VIGTQVPARELLLCRQLVHRVRLSWADSLSAESGIRRHARLRSFQAQWYLSKTILGANTSQTHYQLAIPLTGLYQICRPLARLLVYAILKRSIPEKGDGLVARLTKGLKELR